MPTYAFEPVTPETLSEFHDLNAGHNTLATLRERLERGLLHYHHLHRLRSPRGTEAAVLLGSGPVVIPRVRFDLPQEGLRVLAHELRRRMQAPKQLILDGSIAPLSTDPFVQAGWRVTSHAALYATDLAQQLWSADANVQERPVGMLLAPDLRRFYHELTSTGGTIGDSGSQDPDAALAQEATDEARRLFVLQGDDRVVAAATLTRNPRGEATIHLLGVTPEQRGQGLGRRLHAHVLAQASEIAKRHVGGTSATNVAMRRIFEVNGAKMTSEQYQLTPS